MCSDPPYDATRKTVRRCSFLSPAIMYRSRDIIYRSRDIMYRSRSLATAGRLGAVSQPTQGGSMIRRTQKLATQTSLAATKVLRPPHAMGPTIYFDALCCLLLRARGTTWSRRHEFFFTVFRRQFYFPAHLARVLFVVARRTWWSSRGHRRLPLSPSPSPPPPVHACLGFHGADGSACPLLTFSFERCSFGRDEATS